MSELQNKADELGGKVKEAAGDAVGNEDLANQGKGEQAASKATASEPPGHPVVRRTVGTGRSRRRYGHRSRRPASGGRQRDRRQPGQLR